MLDDIFYRNSNGTIDNVTVNGCGTSVIGGKNGGIYCAGFDGNAVLVEVTNCDILNYTKNGITFNQPNITANINNNVVTGLGSIDWSGQNGIQIGYGATGTISNNTVSNNVYPDTNTWWSTGIVVYESDNVTVTGNNVTHNIAGIYIQCGSNCSVTGNTISNTTGDQAGIMVSDRDDAMLTATNNTIRDNNISGGWAGIWSSYCSDNTYSNNTISGCTGNGIYFWDTDSNIVSGNTISDIHDGSGTGWGIALDGGDTSGTIGSDSNAISSNNG